MTKDEAGEVLKYFDKDGNGMVNFEEFVNTLKVSSNYKVEICRVK